MSFSSWWPGLITLKNWFACNRKYVGESWLFAKIICTRPEMVSEQFSWIRGNNFDYCRQSSPYCIWLSSSVRYHQRSKKCLCLNMEVRVCQQTLVAKRFAQFLVWTSAQCIFVIYQLKYMTNQASLVLKYLFLPVVFHSLTRIEQS